jgi:hypothetical protein
MENTTEEVPKLEVIFKQEGKKDIVFKLSQEFGASIDTNYIHIQLIVEYLQSYINYRNALQMLYV